jgi:plasmid replication initiation protein
MVINPQNNSIVRISNVLNLTRQEFTVVEKHLFHFIMNELKENQGFHLTNIDNREPLEVIIEANKVMKNSYNKQVIKDAIKKITSRNVFFDFSKPGEDYFGSLNPFPFAKYHAVRGKTSFIHIEIHHSCKRLFLELAKGYTNLDLQSILTLKSEYSIRMYELMSMYLNQGSWTVQVDELRTLFNIAPTQYKNFAMFEKRILTYSQTELWEHCNIYFEWSIAAKERKKITALTFNISKREKQERKELKENITVTQNYIQQLSNREIAEKFQIAAQKYRLSEAQLNYIFSNSDIFNEFVRLDLIIEDKISKGKPPKDRTKYLAKSIGLDKVSFSMKKRQEKSTLF